MKNKSGRLPDAELEVMKIIWDSRQPVTSADIMKALEGSKTWGVTTVLNFLNRLQERGFVSSERRGRFNVYQAVVDENTYLKSESKTILEKLYGNSLKSFVASLYESDSLTEKDLKELRDFIDDRTQGGTPNKNEE
ncbi:BlaI/MecI/CopY family transcriptional regulator [Saccharibacillus alkalitolerans]|uniref:BlaI/MecI/CopY family transcriptional regulator n=1 Tax=Saccharibacillus alkalitolerans TaxID=2705290 RepID=A0ABX0F9Q1_9BACL|nr:BlaI/MecI/CopY family transcriptional regulator [Saccharibacillus alkalitolerans]NGZ76293.1 BlaI/MecI/CopY family transcriptional regulator [Saccharibacillus alkalitolerans]